MLRSIARMGIAPHCSARAVTKGAKNQHSAGSEERLPAGQLAVTIVRPQKMSTIGLKVCGCLCVLVASSLGTPACSRPPHACAGEPPCVAEKPLSARARCERHSDAPECACGPADWGAPCSKHVDCKCGLECVDGVCESFTTCVHKDD